MNIYVGNLSYEVTEGDLSEAFGAYGEVASAKIITDRYTGNSKGFGFVEMPNDAEGKVAIESLNGQELKGRTLAVNEARPRPERRPRSGGNGGNGGGGGFGGRSSGGFGGRSGGGRY